MAGSRQLVRPRNPRPTTTVVTCACALLVVACGTQSAFDASLEVTIVPQTPFDAAGADVVLPDVGTTGLPANFFPPPAPAFTAATRDPLSVQVSLSGEALAERGYDYTATPSIGDAVFVDGWEVRFTEYLVVVDHVRLNQPGADPSMRSVVGALVAQQDGPWIVDAHRPGALVGAAGPPESAVPLVVFRATAAGGAFDPTVRYAFSFDTVPATSPNLRNVNLASDQAGDVVEMIARRWTLLFAGTATYRGRTPSASVDPTFQNYPTTVRFRFGFGAPASYINCHNPEVGDVDSPATRGIQASASTHARAQITMHTDHFFWDETDVEGTPLHFDALAARAIGFGGDAGATPLVAMEQLVGDNPASLTDALGFPVLDRGSQTIGTMDNAPPPSYAVHSAAALIHDLRDFVAYNSRSQGHLNSDGLCFVRANGPIAY